MAWCQVLDEVSTASTSRPPSIKLPMVTNNLSSNNLNRMPAGTLSGGQQQMLAIGRGLMAKPRLLLLDEPSLGLSPLLVRTIFDTIAQINAQGTSVLLVEQNVYQSLRIAARGYVLETGKIALSGTGANLLANDEVKAAFLGA